MNNLQRFMQFFYQLLYHPFAITYDLVAAVVSFGNWKNWVFEILPFIDGNHILELGHGPGHLQHLLLNRGLKPVAIDESHQMGRIARRRLGSQQKLSRALAERLPFKNQSFNCVLATFPTEYILETSTLSEIRRCLSDGGRLVILPAAFPRNGFLKWLYRVTGESPPALDESIKKRILEPFLSTGFSVEVKIVEIPSCTLVVLVAKIEMRNDA